MEERRSGVRRRTLRSAKIVYGDYRYTVDCIIRDASTTGLRIRCDHAAEIPGEFQLYDPAENSLQKVEVMWRRDNELGLKYVSPPIHIHESNDPRHARFKFM
ncbi:PilZ domain-containing protein [Oryzibacter oryziterrae]|uniref:PilZ domain-containing protein n=1 Tax=Oryzibacter oryziterrae TaxID=2766474 RepID=UPI001F227611|nr:PilZ domain-containing protein [Oryzibacter oryziterrae]